MSARHGFTIGIVTVLGSLGVYLAMCLYIGWNFFAGVAVDADIMAIPLVTLLLGVLIMGAAGWAQTHKEGKAHDERRTRPRR